MRRVGYAGLAIAALGAGLILAGVATWQLWAFLASLDRGLQRGQLHPRAVAAYNATHRLWLPLALGGTLGGLTLLNVLPRAATIGWTAGACAWVAHIGVDQALGFGLRDRRGFQRAG